jgi:hypothetical protein
MRILFAVLLTVSLALGVSCGGGSAAGLDEDSAQMLRAALTATSGIEITELKMDGRALSISYRQAAGEAPAVQLERWLDMSTVAISFMAEPRDIVIYPTIEGKPGTRVTLAGGDVASLLIGEISFDQALASVEIETLQ